jgi:hypothetical protein
MYTRKIQLPSPYYSPPSLFWERIGVKVTTLAFHWTPVEPSVCTGLAFELTLALGWVFMLRHLLERSDFDLLLFAKVLQWPKQKLNVLLGYNAYIAWSTLPLASVGEGCTRFFIPRS